MHYKGFMAKEGFENHGMLFSIILTPTQYIALFWTPVRM